MRQPAANVSLRLAACIVLRYPRLCKLPLPPKLRYTVPAPRCKYTTSGHAASSTSTFWKKNKKIIDHTTKEEIEDLEVEVQN